MQNKIESVNADQEAAIAMSSEILDNCKAINNTLTIAGVRPHFQAHYAKLGKSKESSVIGIMELVRDILRMANAELPRGIEKTEIRPVAIGVSLFTTEVIDMVGVRFANGTTRYRPQSVRNCLSTYGTQDGTIGKIDLTPDEDIDRESNIPRSKWYLVKKT